MATQFWCDESTTYSFLMDDGSHYYYFMKKLFIFIFGMGWVTHPIKLFQAFSTLAVELTHHPLSVFSQVRFFFFFLKPQYRTYLTRLWKTNNLIFIFIFLAKVKANARIGKLSMYVLLQGARARSVMLLLYYG